MDCPRVSGQTDKPLDCWSVPSGLRDKPFNCRIDIPLDCPTGSSSRTLGQDLLVGQMDHWTVRHDLLVGRTNPLNLGQYLLVWGKSHWIVGWQFHWTAGQAGMQKARAPSDHQSASYRAGAQKLPKFWPYMSNKLYLICVVARHPKQTKFRRGQDALKCGSQRPHRFLHACGQDLLVGHTDHWTVGQYLLVGIGLSGHWTVRQVYLSE